MATREGMAWVWDPFGLRGRLERLVPSATARGVVALASIAVAAAAICASFWAAQGTPNGQYLAGGRRFYSDDAIKICRALDEQRIEYHQDDHRIYVAPEQFDQAAAVVAKLGVGRKPIDELRGPGGVLSSLLETTEDRRRRDQLSRERILESLISQQDGVVWSLVSLHDVTGSTSTLRSTRKAAFVYLETDGDHRLPARTLQLLPSLLAGYVPELAPRAITVMDRAGRKYLDPSDPTLSELSRNQAREEELADTIRERLDWIKGVRVLTRISPHEVVPPQTETRMEPEPAPTITVNHPATIDGEKLGIPQATEPGRASRERDRGTVLVSVPRSFYYSAIVNHAEHKEPSIDELKQAQTRTEGQIRRLVEMITAGEGVWTVDVEMIPDKIPTARPVIATTGSGSRTRGLDWGVVATIVAGAAVITAAGAWRRSSPRPAPVRSARKKLRVDPPEDHTLSERVRELVRQDPEAAASVLERWLTQGESSP